jgi:hypothetical protein
MTIIEAINKVDAIKINTYTHDEKVGWLSTLDGIIYNEIIRTHEGADSVKFNGYDADTPLGTELLAPAPYDEVYIRYLQAQIDEANGELGKYQNSMALFNTAYSNLERYYNRTHMPIGKQFKYI